MANSGSTVGRRFPSSLRQLCKVQGVGALGLGLALLTLSPRTIHTNPLSTWISNNVPGHPRFPLTDVDFNSPVALQAQTLAGIFCSAIGFAYSFTLYQGYEEWLYMSIPARLFVGGVGFAVWLAAPERISQITLLVCVNDLIGAVVAGWVNGKDWSGKPIDRPKEQ